MTSCRWKTAYKAAILESNRYAIPKMASEAEDVILARLYELAKENGITAEIERDALDRALQSLRTFQRAATNTFGRTNAVHPEVVDPSAVRMFTKI